MKKILILGLWAFASLRCTKEDLSVSKTSEALNTESRDNCPCAVRVNSNDGNTSEELSARHLYRIIRKNGTVWQGQIGSWECGSSSIAYDQWYPVALVNDVAYQLRYEYRNNNCNMLAPNVASIAIKCGNNTKTFSMQTGSTPETNPNIMYFGRYNCLILEEQ
jgi:hypothetical protein